MHEFELHLDRVATGGASIGNGPDGRIVFADGGLPGEQVNVRVTAEHRSRLEAAVTTVLEPAPGRRDPPCTHVAAGCGGCDWQHATPELQVELRRSVVLDCLRRLAKIDDAEVRLGPSLDPVGYRTTVRVAVVDGRAGYRSAGSHEIVLVDSCLVAHPLVEEVLVKSTFGPTVTEVTVRAGARTGERILIAAPTADGVVTLPDVVVVGADELEAGREVHYHEEVGGRSFQISASSFFQCRPDGAEALVTLTEEAIADTPGSLLDAYCGVGLFGALVGTGREVVGVESNRVSVADAVVNYGNHGSVVKARMERWRADPMAVVIADPARSGLGKEPARRLAATGAEVIALISCDPGSLARDVGLLIGHGYELDYVTVVDLFGQTSHVETVSRLVRSA